MNTYTITRVSAANRESKQEVVRASSLRDAWVKNVDASLVPDRKQKYQGTSRVGKYYLIKFVDEVWITVEEVSGKGKEE